MNLIFCKCTEELFWRVLDCGLDELHVYIFLGLSPLLYTPPILCFLFFGLEVLTNFLFSCQPLDASLGVA